MTDPAPDSSEDAEALDFEAALTELEALVERMETGDLTLDASLAAFERGILLTRTCQRALTDAEQRVRTLMEREDGSLTLQTADADSGADSAGA